MANTTTPKTILVGKIGAAYGIKGWVKITSYTEPHESIFKYQPWQLQIGKEQKEITLVDSKIQGPYLLALLPNCHDPETARLYTNSEIAVYRDQLPALSKNEYYWTDLEGLQVVNLQNETLGIVDHVFETGANDVLVVTGEKRHLIPFLPQQVIIEVSLENQLIRVDWDPDF